MTLLPKISIQGWTADGPAYTVHRRLDGFRNRHARRRGDSAEELVGPHDALGTALELTESDAAGSMIWSAHDLEAWAFKAPHVYQVTLLDDGHAINVLVDAREGDSIQTYTEDLSLLEHRALIGEELESALENGPAIPGNASDGAESQEPHPDHLHEALVEEAGNADEPIVTLTGAQVEDIAQTAAALDVALGGPAPELVSEGNPDPTELIPAMPVESTPAPVEPESIVETLTGETPTDETVPVDESTPADIEPGPSADGRWEYLEAAYARDQITEAELEELSALQEAALAAQTPSSEDDEDAVGGAADLASDEEE